MTAQAAEEQFRPVGTPSLGFWRWLLPALTVVILGLPWTLQLTGTEAPVLWWASRAFGFVAYGALWAAMLTGVLVSAKGLDGWLDRKVLVELHQQWTLAGVFATAIHVLTVVTNEHAGVGIVGSLVPFAAERLAAPVGLGVISFWMLALVSVSSWFQTRVPYTWWRVIHTISFGAFVLALIHSVASGTDSGVAGVRWAYVGSGSLLAGAIVVRLLVAAGGRSRRRSSRPQPAAAASRAEGSAR